MKTLLFFLAAGCAFAQSWQPDVTNAHFSTQQFGGNLTSQLQSQSPTWFGYGVKTAAGDNHSCCWNGDNRCGCNLENGSSNSVVGSQTNARVRLEGIPAIAVLFRVANQRVEKVHVFSASCPLDAGGLPFVWIDNVPSAASLAYLPGLIKDGSNEVLDGAILAIAQHDDPQADAVLKELSSPPQPERVREKTVFWLGAARGFSGVAILKDILAHDASEHIRDKAVFALSISKQPDAFEWLLSAAKNDPSPHVRGQALFWLAQKAGKQAAAAISDAIQNDPDTGVKERAVFALSQLPKEESIPKLIEVARTQRNPEVRKKAFFWLGQSNDPRALAFFEQVLAK